MGACDPGHVIDIWGYYCEDSCPKCASEKAAGENVCNICKRPQGSGQRHQAGDDFYCLPHVVKVPKDEREIRVSYFKKGFIVGARQQLTSYAPKEKYREDYEWGKEAGAAAFNDSISYFRKQLGLK